MQKKQVWSMLNIFQMTLAQRRSSCDNKSDQPLTLRLPKAFVGVPVLAQFGGGGIGGMGGGMGGGGMGGAVVVKQLVAAAWAAVWAAAWVAWAAWVVAWVAAWAAGMFSVPPEKTKVLKVATVCLEYGKREPSPRMTYRLAALEAFSEDPALAVYSIHLVVVKFRPKLRKQLHGIFRAACPGRNWPLK